MAERIEIRESGANDLAGLEELYARAFPDEDLLPLVGDLTRDSPGVVSLVAEVGGKLAGHIVFAPATLDRHETGIALLGPLAVAPGHQRKGIGTALVGAGVDWLRAAGVGHVLVLGDPAYYGRFGFAAETRVSPPYPLVEQWRSAWQSLATSGAPPLPEGRLGVAPAWRRRELWSP